jgi:transcriptional regulator with PAS, ATPase and Fis domain
MGTIDQMKYAKILYLADVLEDIQNEMSRDYHCRNYTESISGIVKGLRETIAVTDAQGEIKCEDFEIRRIESRQEIPVLDVPIREIGDMEKRTRRYVENTLLNEIAKKKLIDIHRHEDRDNNKLIYTASLIVGVSKRPYVPQETPPTFVDDLAKYLEETRQ